MTDIRVRHKEPRVLRAWQYPLAPGAPFPLWVEACTTVGLNDELLLIRRSGMQRINRGEWLVHDLDAGILWYPDDTYQRTFEPMP